MDHIKWFERTLAASASQALNPPVPKTTALHEPQRPLFFIFFHHPPSFLHNRPFFMRQTRPSRISFQISPSTPSSSTSSNHIPAVPLHRFLLPSRHTNLSHFPILPSWFYHCRNPALAALPQYTRHPNWLCPPTAKGMCILPRQTFGTRVFIAAHRFSFSILPFTTLQPLPSFAHKDKPGKEARPARAA